MTESADNNVKLKHLELWIGLLKFFIGTVIMGLVSLYLNHQYQSNQLDLEKEKSAHAIALQDKKAEFDYLSKFMTHAMNEDLQVRIRLADYMQSAALSENIKEIWKRYHALLIEQQAETLAKREALKQQEKKLASQLAVDEENDITRKKWMQQMEEVRREIYYLQDQLDRRRYGEFQESYIDVYELARLADNESSAGNYAQAISYLKQALEHGGEAMEWLFLSDIAANYRAMRDFTNAEIYANRAIEQNASDPGALFSLAIMQKNNQRLDQAIKNLRKAESISEGPTKLDIQLALAGYLFLAGQKAEGEKKFADIKDAVENNTLYATNLAWYRAVVGPKDAFYIAFERALQLDTTGNIFQWIDAEVDLDKYRGEEKFKQLMKTYSYKRR